MQSVMAMERREGLRIDVEWQSTCEIGLVSLVCKIRDVGTDGAFLEPAGVGVEPWLSALTSTQWQLTLNVGGNKAPATVRWIGFSGKHDCNGLGIQFL